MKKLSIIQNLSKNTYAVYEDKTIIAQGKMKYMNIDTIIALLGYDKTKVDIQYQTTEFKKDFNLNSFQNDLKDFDSHTSTSTQENFFEKEETKQEDNILIAVGKTIYVQPVNILISTIDGGYGKIKAIHQISSVVSNKAEYDSNMTKDDIDNLNAGEIMIELEELPNVYYDLYSIALRQDELKLKYPNKVKNI